MEEQRTFNPLVEGSNPSRLTRKFKGDQQDQGIHSKRRSYSNSVVDQGIPLREAVDSFLLSCKVEGKSRGTLDCYADKLRAFLWYAQHGGLPDNPAEITTQHIREFLAYLRDNDHRWGSDSLNANKPVNSTTIQRYYRVLSVFWNWMIAEELVVENPLWRIKAPKAEKKIIKGLSPQQVSRLLQEFDNSFNGKRNRAMILVFIDSGLRLGEALNLELDDAHLEHQVLTIGGKTGERIVRFGTATAKALLKYLLVRSKVKGASDKLWLTSQGQPLTAYGVEMVFRRLSARTGVAVHPHLLRHTFATMWLRNGGDSLMLQRLLGHTTLAMTNRYCQAVGSLDAVESHKRYSPVDNLRFK